MKNTVNGIPEATFREYWISMLWQAMGKLAKGYRRPKVPRSERRADKVGTTKLMRRVALTTCPVLRRVE